MAGKQTIIIAGASARAAAFSALRAGLEPYCFDLFADADLALRCPVVKLDAAGYPRNLLKAMRQAPPGPWMYTGGLENHPGLIHALSRKRPLWGCGAETLRRARSQASMMAFLSGDRVMYPPIRTALPEVSEIGNWIVKPVLGSGGRGISVWQGESIPSVPRYYTKYLQPLIPGPTVSALFAGDATSWRLLGLTWQLVGQPWLNAKPFAYCASIGLAEVSGDDQRRILWIGKRLVLQAGARGLFGVDIVMGERCLCPVDINPRYTASVEVVEFALGSPILYRHRVTFDADAEPVGPFGKAGTFVGKAILFARESFTFPADGPWRADLDPRRPIEAMPAYADIPHAGSFIEKGWPVLTFFASGATVDEVREKLKGIAAELNERFWPQSAAL